MVDLADSIKSSTEQTRHLWVADSRLCNPATYEDLARPATFAALKAAGIGHVVLDLPDMLRLEYGALLDGRRSPGDLAKAISGTPTYSIYSSHNTPPIPAETIAAIMLAAQASGTELHFTGSSVLEMPDSKALQGTFEAERLRGHVTVPAPSLRDVFTEMGGRSERKEYALQEQLKDPRTVLSQTYNRILDGHRKQLDETVAEVQDLPPGARALIIHQGTLPLDADIESLMGAEKVSIIDPVATGAQTAARMVARYRPAGQRVRNTPNEP